LAETISFNQYAAALPHRQSLLRNLLAIESDRAARGTCRDKMRAKAGCGAVRQGTDDQPISVRTCAMISRRKRAQSTQQGPKTGFDGDPGQTHPIYRRSAAQVEAELCLLCVGWSFSTADAFAMRARGIGTTDGAKSPLGKGFGRIEFAPAPASVA
jgi:hypothetical protein